MWNMNLYDIASYGAEETETWLNKHALSTLAISSSSMDFWPRHAMLGMRHPAVSRPLAIVCMLHSIQWIAVPQGRQASHSSIALLLLQIHLYFVRSTATTLQRFNPSGSLLWSQARLLAGFCDFVIGEHGLKSPLIVMFMV
jgi:hypothetical protein